MQFEHLTPYQYIRWNAAERAFKSWNTIGQVVELTDEWVTILTFDDFKRTTLKKDGGDAIETEITPITKTEAMDYLEQKAIDLTYARANYLRESTKKLATFDDNIKICAQLLNATQLTT